MAYRLLVCDLDGTLIDKSMELAPDLVEAFRAAQARGLMISIATGRMPPGVDRYRDELGLTAPLIFYNGGLLRDPATGADLFSLTLSRGLLARLYPVFANAPINPLFYRDDTLYCLERSMVVRQYEDEQGLRAETIPEALPFLRQGGFAKALFMGHPAVLPVLRADLDPLAGSARLTMTRADYLEVIPEEASKGMALGRLAEHLGLSLAQVIAVGDQENDLEMLQAAGLGIAMPQAPERVRAAAGRVAPPAAAGGLLALFRELLPTYFG